MNANALVFKWIKIFGFKRKRRMKKEGRRTCFRNSSACGANAVGSASRTNCITSSMDQEEGLLPLGILGVSHSADAAASGPVVELAAKERDGERENIRIHLWEEFV